LRTVTLFLSMILTAALPLLACKEPKTTEHKKTVALTEEEKEILQDRELLENLELLQSFDKIQYLELFTDQDQKTEESQAVPAKKKTEGKNEKPSGRPNGNSVVPNGY
jgi:hypothetical protein